MDPGILQVLFGTGPPDAGIYLVIPFQAFFNKKTADKTTGTCDQYIPHVHSISIRQTMQVTNALLSMFKMLNPATPGEVLSAVKIFPDGKCLGIVFQLRVGYGTGDVIADICLMHFIIIKGIYSFPLIIGPDPIQVHVDRVIFLHGAEHIDEAEGEQPSVAFLQGLCQ